jgi:dihydrofolate reductase
MATVAAGAKDIWLMGAADVARQFLREGLVGEIRVHIVPVLLGAGSHPFNDHGIAQTELQVVTVTSSPLATHITYRVVKPSDPAR